MVREGTIVDATIINAPSSNKNAEHKRDPEMKSIKKMGMFIIMVPKCMPEWMPNPV